MPVEGCDCVRLEDLFPSDSLVGMRNLLASAPVLYPLLRQVVHVRLVIDANIVQQELRWRSARRRNPAARSSLQEAIDSGIVVALAPTFLKSEIEDHLPDMSAETGVPVEVVRQHWQDFQTQLNFYEPRVLGHRLIDAVDQDDVPYKRTCEELGADAVYTYDGDLGKMKVPVISVPLDLTLRKHARSSSVVIGVTLGSGFVLTISFEALREAYRVIQKTILGFQRLPEWAKLGMGGFLLGVLAHPKSRAKLIETWSCVRRAAEECQPGVFAAIAEVAMQFFAAQQLSSQTYAEIQSALPQRRRRSAIQFARSICLISGTPLSVSEIKRRMLNEGYSTRSKNFSGYLRRLLRESEQFAEVAPGVWSLQAA
jgi:hypothetical protein